MVESANYPHVPYENAAFSQANTTTSSNMQTQFNNDHRAGAWIRDGGATTRAAAIWYESRLAMYRVVKDSAGTITQADFATLSAAADDAAAFVDSENTPS